MESGHKGKYIVIAVAIALIMAGAFVFLRVLPRYMAVEMPGFMVSNFEEAYIVNDIANYQTTLQRILNIGGNTSFELIDTVEYTFAKGDRPLTYSGVNEDAGVVLSFVSLHDPIKYTVVAPNSRGDIQTVTSGFPHNMPSTAYYLPLKAQSAYEFTYSPNTAPQEAYYGGTGAPQAAPNLNLSAEQGGLANLKEPVSGRFNVYKIVEE